MRHPITYQSKHRPAEALSDSPRFQRSHNSVFSAAVNAPTSAVSLAARLEYPFREIRQTRPSEYFSGAGVAQDFVVSQTNALSPGDGLADDQSVHLSCALVRVYRFRIV